MKNALALALLLTVFGSNAMAAKSGGNGDSYSGPTLSPNAIAVSVDKPILAGELKNTLSACLIQGKKNSFLNKFLNPIYNNTTAKLSHMDVFLTETAPEVNDNKISLYLGLYMVYEEDVTDSSNGGIFQVALKSNGSLIVTEIGLSGNVNGISRRQFEINEFPIIKAKTSVVENYDPITGDFKGNDLLLENLQVSYDFRNASPYVKAFNITNGKKIKTQLSAPVAEYTNCVIEKLGKI